VYGYEGQVEDLMAQYQQRLAGIGELQRKMKAISGTAASARQSVKVTVDVNGEITALEFPTGAYKRLPPTELSAEILATARDAKAKAKEQLDALMAGELPADRRLSDLTKVADIVKGKADPAEMFSAEPSMPDAIRAYIETGRTEQD
jgi:DNA-binding protein YbaB